jgi:hypothetical protein
VTRRGRTARGFAKGCVAALLAALVAIPCPTRAGGPLYVGGPSIGTEGAAIVWDTSQPIAYRVDGGALSINPSGTVTVDNPTGITIVQGMFQAWESVTTANIRYTNAGGIQNVPPNFTDGDVSNVTEIAAVDSDCSAGNQNPIVFDANGSIFNALIGDPSVIGFAGVCKIDGSTGRIVSAWAVLNGIFRDGVSSSYNYELTAAQFNEVFTHEFGHFSGLDHSQINVAVLNGTPNACSVDTLAGLPLMFPVLFCQARSTVGLPILAPDDMAWISQLYPETGSGTGQTPFSGAYGTISGTIVYSDGVTQAQGVNVIARRVSDGNPANGDETKRIAFSVVSGYRFTGRIGQSVTTNSPPSKYGSQQASLIGTYEIPVTPGTYTVEVESIDAGFSGGSSVGPVDPPIANPGLDEFWDNAESATDTPSSSSPVTVSAGQTVSNINIILNGTPPRFDSFESAEAQTQEETPRWLRREKSARELVSA